MPKQNQEFGMIDAQIITREQLKYNGEIASYNDSDMMFIRGLVVYEGLNANNALLQRDDLQRAVDTLDRKPLWIRFINGNPTGHGYDPDTGTFDMKNRRVIGSVLWAYGEENQDTKRYEVMAEMVVYQKYYPEIASRLRQLHSEGGLKFSYEMTREFEETPEGYRRCFNIQFNGMCVVQNPAFEDTRSLSVAEDEEKGGNGSMDFEKMYNELKGLHEELAGKVDGLEKAKTEAENKVTEVSEQLAEVQGQIKIVTAERDTYKGKVESAEKSELGQQRLTKLQKYGEVKETVDELAEMTKEDFVTRLEEAVVSFKPTGTEQAGKEDGIVGTPFAGDSTKTSRKQQLLGLVEGLGKRN